jgi:hypothetical protein
MNKTEWDASNDPLPMLDWLRERGSERKFRLFACACMRRMEAIYRDYDLELLPGVAAEEVRADGGAVVYTPPRRGLWAAGYPTGRTTARNVLESFGRGEAWEAARNVVWAVSDLLQVQAEGSALAYDVPPLHVENPREARSQAALLRDLFGHLFHPDPLWLARLTQTDEGERIARAIYEDRSFADLPVLADALEEAGCTDAAILEHCREPGEHARGCWVIDAILGRS